MVKPDDRPAGAPRLLLTAEEAFPAFERLVLAARSEILAGFRLFDISTKLRSPEARAVGEDWFDLIVHVLRRGVRVELTLSDFDPIVSPEMHLATWASQRKLWAAAELAGSEADLILHPGMHPECAGWLPRVILWPRVLVELAELRNRLNGLMAEERRAVFRNMPRLHPWLRADSEGRLRIRRWTPPELRPVTHHQKIAVIDGQTLYIGGLDLNPRRYDTPAHARPAEETWHDIQVVCAGRAAQAGARHLTTFRDIARGDHANVPDGDGLVTTISARRSLRLWHLSPRVVNTGIDRCLRGEIAAAQRLIYLETQFFRDRRLAALLARTGSAKPDLSLLMILPAAPEAVAFEGRTKMDVRFGEYLQARCIERVRRAFGDRAFFASPAQRRVGGPGLSHVPDQRDRFLGAPLVYVHAKLCVFDDDATLVSSANLNGRSLKWDTEAGLIHRDPGFAKDTRTRALAHWLPGIALPDDISSINAAVRAQAFVDAARRPQDREGFLLPHDTTPAAEFGHVLPGIPDEMV